jgi:antitoxin component YwqK of YwqJK toxin-antitoxin module
MEGYLCLENISIPLFYQNRASKEVLFKHRGAKIFMGSSKGWQIEDALMHDLGRESFAFDAGLHAGNFATHIALSLGCKKIVLAGMDGVSKIGERGDLLKEGKATRADLYYGMDFFAMLQENFPSAEIEHYTVGFSFKGSKVVNKIQIAPKKRDFTFKEPVCSDYKQVKRVFDLYFSHDLIPLFETLFKKVKEDNSFAKLHAVILLTEISSTPLYIHFLYPLWEVWKYLLKNSEDELAKMTFFYSVLQSIKGFLGLLMKEGPYQRFDKRGTLREEGYIFNGKAEFERKKYDEEGKLICLEKMKEGVCHGECKVYKHDGLVFEGTFVKGVAHGPHVCYYKGKIVDLQEFDHGKKCGISKIYDDNGVKREEIVYKEKDLFDRIKFDEVGQKIYEGIFHGDRFIEKRFMDGKELSKREGKMVDGVLVFLEQQ